MVTVNNHLIVRYINIYRNKNPAIQNINWWLSNNLRNGMKIEKNYYGNSAQS